MQFSEMLGAGRINFHPITFISRSEYHVSSAWGLQNWMFLFKDKKTLKIIYWHTTSDIENRF